MIAEHVTNGEKHAITHARIRYKRIPPMAHDDAKEALLRFKEVYDRHGITFWLVFGTLLGAVRDGDFIPWDTDIDLACYWTDLEKICVALDELQVMGFQVIMATEDDGFFEVQWKGIYIHVGVMRLFRGTMWQYAWACERHDYFSKLKTIPFLGTTFLIPQDAEAYLREHYSGERWKTPDPSYKQARIFKVKRG